MPKINMADNRVESLDDEFEVAAAVIIAGTANRKKPKETET